MTDSHSHAPLTLIGESSCLPPRDGLEWLDQHLDGHATLVTGSFGKVAGALALLGAGDGPATPPWWTRDPLVERGALAIYGVRDAAIMPELGVVVAPTGAVMESTFKEAAFLHEDLASLPGTSASGRGPRLELGESPTRIKSSIITMPWGARSNYGHFVLDCLPAVAAVQALGLREHDFVFPRLTTWQREHLRLVGLNDYQELDASLVVADHVVFTNAMDHYLHRPSEATLEVRHQQLSRAGPGSAPGIKLYLSRRGDGKRLFDGEATLERNLESLGFVIVDPGALSVTEQIRLFRDASVIVGPTGAAFANVLYAKPGSLVVEIQPRLLQGIWVRNLCLLGGFKHQPYFVGGEPPTSVVSVGGVSRPEIGQVFEVESAPFLRSLENAMSRWQEI